jgi:hypothetical protein
MNEVSFLHDDLQYMRTLCKNIFNDYKNKYIELDKAQERITGYYVIWSNYYLEYKPLFEWLASRKKIKIYKKKPKTVPFIYGTRFGLNNDNKPYYCCCLCYDKIYEEQFFIYDKFNQNELLLLFFHTKKGKMELEKIEIIIRNTVTGGIQYDYIYGYSKKLKPNDFPLKIEYEFNEKFIRDEYMYENDLVTQVRVTGDQNGIAKVVYKKNEVDFIGFTYDYLACHQNFSIVE